MSSYIKRRIPRKKAAEPDEILTLTAQISDRIRGNVNLIIFSVGTVLFVAVISLGMMWLNGKKEVSATRAILGAKASYGQKGGVDSAGEAEVAADGLRESLAGFREVLSEYPDMIQGKSAALYAANILFQLGSYQEAAVVVGDLISRDPDFANDLNAPNLMARALEGSGDYDAALDAYDGILQRTREDQRALLMMDMARCYELSGDSASAIEIYRNVVEQFQNSVFAVKADIKLAILGVQAEESL